MQASVADRVVTKGCLSIGDGGQGTFIASATPVGPVNVYSCIESATAGVYLNLQPVNGAVVPEQFGAVGDGVADDTDAVQRAIDYSAQNNMCIGLLGAYLQSGLTIPSNCKILGLNKTCGFTGSGLINGRSLGANNQHLEGFKISGTVQLLVGSTLSATFAKNITINDIYVETDDVFGVQVQLIENLNVNNLNVTLTGSGQNHGFKMANIKNSKVDGVSVVGNTSIGVSLSGTGTLSIASAENCDIRNIYVQKNDAYTNITGDHGVYFLGMSHTHIENVRVVGTWTVISTYSVKFRDSHDCTWKNIWCKSARVTADNNTVVYQDTLRNKFTNLNCETLLLFKDAAGSISELTFEDLHVSSSIESNSIDGPVYLTGDIYLGNTGEIRLQGVEFSSARVSIPNMNSSANRFRYGVLACNSEFMQLLHVYNSNADLSNCKINGLLRMDSTGGTTNLLLSNSYVDGSFFMNSSGARVANANISNTSFNSVEDANANNNPDIKKYRFVAFNNVVYDLLNLP
jgi:hypothetical protein